MTTVKLTGAIVPLQPICVNVPGLPDRARIKTVHVRPYFTETGESVQLPGMTGANIKGAIRNAGGLPALAEVYGAEPGNPGSYDVLGIEQNYNASGGLASSGPDSAEDLVAKRKNRERDVHSALFGSYPLKTTGVMHVFDAVPDPGIFAGADPADLLGMHHGARRDMYRTNPSLLSRHPDAEVERFLERTKRNKDLSAIRTELKGVNVKIAKLKARKEALDDAERASLKELEDRRKALDEDKGVLQKGGAESYGRTFDPFHFIPAGLRLRHEIKLAAATDAEIGYAFRCLRHFSLACRLGARESTGFGAIRMEYAVGILKGFDMVDVGRLVVGPEEFSLDVDDPLFARAHEAYEEARRDRLSRFDLTLVSKASSTGGADTADEEVA